MAERADHFDRGEQATPLAEDVLVFEAQPDGFKLIGGKGRGAGWANVVELRMIENPTVAQAWKVTMPVRVATATPTHVAGPYWAADAVLVPVGHAHLVSSNGADTANHNDIAPAAPPPNRVGSIGARQR